jgi:xanthine dehydrogenase accessory factor
MTCHSGGTVDIYLEPVLPSPQLVLFGSSPVVRALARLGEAMGYGVTVVESPAAPEVRAMHGPNLHAVVATMGENDEDSVAAALAAQPGYLAVVASRRRFAELRASLTGRGVPAEALDRVHNPAGLDIGARLPEELALSILAEIVKLRRAAAPAVVEETPAEREEIDPICGMTVVVATAKHVAEHDGKTYYFCNPRCREKFLATPARWIEAARAAR